MSIKQSSVTRFRHELDCARQLCQDEEDLLSDAETLGSDTEAESEEDESYDSDFIDDSDVTSGDKWKVFDIREMEDTQCSAAGWVKYRPCIRC